MGTARLIESFWTCRKRYRLERWLVKHGHRWSKHDAARVGEPLSAADCCGLILSWLDSRDDPHGYLPEQDAVEEVELAAAWAGKSGLLWEGLVATDWIVERDGRWQWHDYAAVNAMTIRGRLKKRGQRGGQTGGQPGGQGGGRDGGQPEGREGGHDGGRDGGRTPGPHGRARCPEVPKSRCPEVPMSRGPEGPPVSPQGEPAPAAPRRAASRRAVSPFEAAARRLSTRLGSGLRPCQAQIRALRAEGWDLERIEAAIESHAAAGLAPWDWTKLAKGTTAPPRHGGLTGEQIRRLTERPPDSEVLGLGGGAP
jgi:hypothetical protein